MPYITRKKVYVASSNELLMDGNSCELYGGFLESFLNNHHVSGLYGDGKFDDSITLTLEHAASNISSY